MKCEFNSFDYYLTASNYDKSELKVSQCYDGAAVMSGIGAGVQALLQ